MESEYLGDMTKMVSDVRKYVPAFAGWLVLLLAIALLQNYLRYGQYEQYNIWNSLIYLGVTVLLFFPFGLAAVAQMIRTQTTVLWRYALIGILALAAHYLVGTVAIHWLGLYDSFFEIKFARQYFGREAFFHALSLVVLGYFISQRQSSKKMISGTLGRKELTLQANKVSWIEADDHYLKIYVDDTQIVKRATLEKMAEELSPDFIRIHRRYLVNRKQIVGTEKQHRDEYVVLASGQRLKIGRSYAPLEM